MRRGRRAVARSPGPRAAEQECISVGGCTGFTVRDNHVIDCGKEGICLKDGSTGGQVYGNLVDGTGVVGIYVDSEFFYTSAIAVFGNVVHAAGTDGSALASEAGNTVLQNVQVYDNVVYCSRFVGLALYPCDLGVVRGHPVDGAHFW